MSRTKKWLLRLAKTLAVTALLIALVHGVLSLVWGRRYEHEINRIKASGGPVSPMDLAGQPVPDAENGALIFESIFARPWAYMEGAVAMR